MASQHIGLDAFLSQRVGKHISVWVLAPGAPFQGKLVSIFDDSIVLHTDTGTVLIRKAAIAVIDEGSER